MNWDTIKGNWKQMTGEITSEWGKLSEDEVSEAAGDREHFIGMIQEKYGLAKEEAQQQVDQFISKHT